MLGISPKEVLDGLKRDNPWWSSQHQFSHTLNQLKRAYFLPFVDLVLNWEVRRSTVLLGPRRVGKTVMLQQLVDEALSRGFDGQSVMMVSIDVPLYTGLSLETLVRHFLTQNPANPDGRKLIIFDEIQYLKDWETHLKVLTDQFSNIRFVASGSAAAALRLRSRESGAGRFTEFFLPPLTFAEFLNFRGREKSLVQVASGDALARRFQTSSITELNQEFVDYINFGGYPEAVLNQAIRSDSRRYLGNDIVDKVLLRDLPSLYGIQDTQELNRLFMVLAYNTSQEISLEQLSKSSGVAKNTISKYLEYLEAAFLILRVTRIDASGKTFQRQRQFKVYLTNVSMRAALFGSVLPDDPQMGALAETAILSQWFHSPDRLSNLHYARWKRGRSDCEVDLVEVDRRNLAPKWAYEVKWSDRFAEHPNELIGLLEFGRQNFDKKIPLGATTKTRTAKSDVDGFVIQHFPCSLHCYQIGRNLADNVAP